MAQFQLGVSLTLLKRDLALMVQSTEKKIAGTPGKDIIVKEYLLIPKTVQSSNYVTYSELKDDFNKIFGQDSNEATGKIENQLKEQSTEQSTFDINEIHFYLKTAYLYKKAYYTKKTATESEKECDENGNDLADGKNAKWEYALSISIDSKDFFSEFKTMSINSVSFSIWNTEREVVKKMMALGSTDEIFKQLEESSK